MGVAAAWSDPLLHTAHDPRGLETPNMELPLHPKLVHLPMALAVLLPLLASGVLLAVVRSWLPWRSWALVIAAQAALFLSGIFAMRSGEADEDRVERVVPEAAIEAHEHAAERFVWAAGLVLLLSVLPSVLRHPRASAIAGAATIVGTLVVSWTGYAVGKAGGELVYVHNAGAAFASAPAVPGAPAGTPQRRDEHDDR